MKPWFRGTLLEYSRANIQISKLEEEPDVFILATYPEEPHHTVFKSILKKNAKSKVLLTVHNPKVFVEFVGKMTLSELGQYDIKAAVLSPWAENYLRQLIDEELDTYGHLRNENALSYFSDGENNIVWLPTLFPYGPIEEVETSKLNGQNSTELLLTLSPDRPRNGLCIQGLIENTRRDFGFLFDTLNQTYSSKIIETLEANQEKIRIIGRPVDEVKSKIPAQIEHLVDFQLNLRFPVRQIYFDLTVYWIYVHSKVFLSLKRACNAGILQQVVPM